MGGETRVYGGPKWTVSPVYEGMLKEELDAAAERHPDVPYVPVLIDATYAGLLTGATETPLVIPALNRDGDCLSDLVLPMFGSIAGAESILLAFDDDYDVDVAMAEAPHGTAPSLMGKDLANPMAMLLACGALLQYAGGKGHDGRRARLARDLRGRARDDRRRACKTIDLGGHATTTRVHRRGGREDPHQGRHLVDRSAPGAERRQLARRLGRRSARASLCKIDCRTRVLEARRRAKSGDLGAGRRPEFAVFRPTAVVAFTNTCSPR